MRIIRVTAVVQSAQVKGARSVKLYEMDTQLMRLRASVGEPDPAVIGLAGTDHNLLRMWADV